VISVSVDPEQRSELTGLAGGQKKRHAKSECIGQPGERQDDAGHTGKNGCHDRNIEVSGRTPSDRQAQTAAALADHSRDSIGALPEAKKLVIVSCLTELQTGHRSHDKG
jgi:hypothetical protein